MTTPQAPDPLAAIAKARGTARLIVTTTPGVTMTVLAQEELVDAIAAALAREAATHRHAADHWFTEANREHNARVRVEGERDDARATVSEWRSGLAADWTGHMLRCARINGRWSCDPRCPSQRLAALEAALRGARQRVDEYDNLLCWCRNLRMFADSLHDNGCRSARAALAPPERSRVAARVAAPPEPPRADDAPRGA